MSIDIISRLESISRDNTPISYTDDVMREFRRAVLLEQRGEKVLLAFTLHYANAERYGSKKAKPAVIPIFRDNGIAPRHILKKMMEAGGIEGALNAYANQRAGVSVEAGMMTAVEMHLFPG